MLGESAKKIKFRSQGKKIVRSDLENESKKVGSGSQHQSVSNKKGFRSKGYHDGFSDSDHGSEYDIEKMKNEKKAYRRS